MPRKKKNKFSKFYNSKKEGGDARHVLYNEKDLPPLLTPEQEVELHKQMNRGPLTKRHEAKQRFIESNLRLVITIARSYENLGLDFEDVVSEGNIGLYQAVDKFDPSKGAKFSTYAGYWIRQKITRALSTKADTIRLPVYLKQLFLNIRKYKDKFELENNRLPTNLEIAKQFEITEQKVLDISEATLGLLRLDSPVEVSASSNQTAETLNNVIPDHNTDSPLEHLEDSDQAEILHKLLSKLDKRERFTLVRRFGLDNEEPETLEGVGVKLGVTRERIRQIEKVALAKLKQLYVKAASINC